MDDQTGKTVDTCDEISKTNQERCVGKGEENQANRVEPPRYFKRQLSAFDIPHNPVKNKPNKSHRLHGYLHNQKKYLIKYPPEIIPTEKPKSICKGMLMQHIILDIVRMVLAQLLYTLILASYLRRQVRMQVLGLSV